MILIQTRDMAMIMLGVVGCMAYQKYSKPVKQCMDNMVESTLDKANSKLTKINRK